ncbi:MAG: tRNA (adenosine(37)-N6)-threonylcarbamoyltransferase complex ATPase subunit type 1 TsaE [Clostridia bacterium]|nr:tRNA (adenosine(37)-N6)-threonylcarbamoyltransferase complex ATPase subunit type 1 TsaE [Clostridia bacterium]MBR4186165.1 tRNA (adenosine(37)-N6)-threonylcarbamoyltransferase complex ATPase subunit type 1 TsaE [Clostridia bacterium]
MEFITNTPEETEEIGRRLGILLARRGTPSFVAMTGDLGAGKTVFVRGMASVLSPGSRVKSPTYTIVNEYRRGPVPFFHFDLYRIADAEELDGFGFDEYLARGISVAEWSERLGGDLPEEAVRVAIEKTGEASRRISVDGLGEGEDL